MVTVVKMQVIPDLSERIQEIVFKNGGNWGDNSAIIKHTDKPYLFIDENKRLYYVRDKESFEEDIFEEISAYDFIASQGEQKWLPMYGEEALFSNDYKTWQAYIFNGYIPESSHPYYTVPMEGFVSCRPLPKPKTI